MKYYEILQKLVHFRGTKKQIKEKISRITTEKEVKLTKCEGNLKDNDLAFQFHLGMDGNDYLDFDIYMLKTRAKETSKRVFLITEINTSY